MKDREVEIDYIDILKYIGDNLLHIKESQGEKQSDMAVKLKTNQGNLSKIINGSRDIRLNHLYYLAVEYGVNLNWLFGLSKEKYNRESRVFHKSNLDKKARLPKRAFTSPRKA